MTGYNFGENIKRAMEDKRVSQRELAFMVSAHHITVNKWIKGKSEPSAYYVGKISESLKVPIEELYYGKPVCEIGEDCKKN